MKVGVVFPQTEIGADPIVIRDFAQAVESLGFSHLIAYDHVLGADVTNRPGWNMPYTHQSTFHEPLVLFSYLAGLTTTLGFASGVLILPQRQTALVAKQAANVDRFLGGRLRLGVGIGWNPLEYEALDTSFKGRGARLEEQVAFMRRLWTEPSFSFTGRHHKLTEGGINPLPVQQPIPVWFGGVSSQAMQRAARLGDGWMPVRPATMAEATVGEFRELVVSCGRDPDLVGLENIVFVGRTLGGERRTVEDAIADCVAWRKAGASHTSIHTMGADLATPDAHIGFLRRVSEGI